MIKTQNGVFNLYANIINELMIGYFFTVVQYFNPIPVPLRRCSSAAQQAKYHTRYSISKKNPIQNIPQLVRFHIITRLHHKIIVQKPYEGQNMNSKTKV
jgi:hypothetical protein